jgi:hypothetical protein
MVASFLLSNCYHMLSGGHFDLLAGLALVGHLGGRRLLNGFDDEDPVTAADLLPFISQNSGERRSQLRAMPGRRSKDKTTRYNNLANMEGTPSIAGRRG